MNSPAEFITIAEEIGLIVDLGLFVLERAARQLGQWQRTVRQRDPVFCSVNVSSRQLLRQDLVHDLRTLIDHNPVFKARTQGIAFLDLEGCMALGVTGPILRATGLPWDLRKSQPYQGYETYEFDVPTQETCDAYGRYLVRIEEIDQSLRIVQQCVDRLAERTMPNDPWLIQDAKIGWPARLSLGPDGMGPSPEHIAHIMGQSMEALIHHFKLVTEGFRVPAGQAYVPIESARLSYAPELADGSSEDVARALVAARANVAIRTGEFDPATLGEWSEEVKGEPLVAVEVD